MKIVLAIDSFKGSLTSAEAEQAAHSGIQAACPGCETVQIPIADGGEGMLGVMLAATGGSIQTVTAHDPCMKPIVAGYGLSTDGTTAFIEMAAVSGLPLVPAELRNPMKTTTYGTGELIRDALERGCTRFVIGIGGSATNDAGTGMLQALGFRFLDKEGNTLGQGGEILQKAAHICTQEAHPSLKNAHFIVACDVQSPFYGPEGAAYVFARQKGADDAMTAELDKGLRSFSEVLKKCSGKDIGLIPGSGAAGGTGGGMMALLNAELKSGADLLLDISRFDERIADADLIITGEGRMDRQSLMGKITGKILQRGLSKGIPVIALAGCVEDKALLTESGFKQVYATKPEEMTLEEAMNREVAMRCVMETAAHAIQHSSHNGLSAQSPTFHAAFRSC